MKRRPVLVAAIALAVLVGLVVGLVVVLLVTRPFSRDTPTPPRSGPTTDTAPTQTPGPAVRLAVPQRARADLAAATGFAREVTGGSRGRLYRVTSPGDDATDPQPGTLRDGLARTGPTWIVFESDMTIRLEAPLEVPSDTTIDGRDRRVTLTGHGHAGLHVYDASNVILENLTLRDFGDTALTASNDPDDAVDVQRSSGVWIDHCTLAEAGDKLIAIEDGGADVTVSWNHFLDQEQTLQIGSLSTAANDAKATVSVHHNYFDHVGYRLPMVFYARAHVYNNYFRDWTVSAVRSARVAQVYLEANVFAPQTNRKAAIVQPAQRCNDKGTLCDDRPGYLASVDNLIIGRAAIRESEPGRVFDPADAYPYVAEKASAELTQEIVSGSGAAATGTG